MKFQISIALTAALVPFACGKMNHKEDRLRGRTAKPPSCTTIQDGTLAASDGSLVTTGYDEWGYNYQAHLFNGLYSNADRDAGAPDAAANNNKGTELSMKWNDAWLSNKDCNGDGKLDRHHGFDSYFGSGAWLTNHMSGEYEYEGKLCKWTSFFKIVALPADGTVIWGDFAIIQEISNDPCADEYGLAHKGPRPGLGNWEMFP